MIDYHTYMQIRELRLGKHLNKVQIGKALNLNVKTVDKWQEKERYEPQTRSRKPTLLDSFKGKIQAMLERHDYSSAQIFQMIEEEGYQGKITTVRQYVSNIRPPKKKAFLTLHFTEGDYAQVDWGHCGTIPVGNTSRRLSVFVMVLCYSRMLYVELTLSQNQEHFLQCHRNAFEFFGGVPAKIMVDNCKTAVIDHPKFGAAVPNPRYADMAAHYGFEIRPCAVRQPQQKGIVEKAIDYVKGNFIKGLEADSFTMACELSKTWRDSVANQRIHGQTRKVPQTLFLIEKPRLMPLPIHPYDCAVVKDVLASPQFRVTLDTNRYSVPPNYAGAKLILHRYPHKLLLYHDQKLVAEHLRSYERNRDFENPDHVKELLQQRRRARDQKMICAFLKLTAAADTYYQTLKDKQLNALIHIRKIMALTEIYGNEKVARALEDACELRAFSSDYIANILHLRHHLNSQTHALHLTRSADLLQLEIPEPDLSIYDTDTNHDKNNEKTESKLNCDHHQNNKKTTNNKKNEETL